MRPLTQLLIRLTNFQGFKNASWNMIGTVVYPILMLVATPLFINKLGPSQFGIWMLVNTITQMMGIFNMGLGDANIRYISRHRAEKNNDEIDSVVSTTIGIGLIIGLSGILLGLVLSYIIDTTNSFNISEKNRPLIAECISISFLLFMLKFFEIIILSIFQGFERYDLAAKYSLVSKVIVLVGNIVIVFTGGNLIKIFTYSALLQFGMLLIEVFAAKRKYIFLSLAPRYNRKQIKKVFSFSLWTWLQSVLAIGASQADKFIVAFFSGVQVLSYYSLGYMLMTQIHAVLSTAIGWIFPVVSKKFTEGVPLKNLLNNVQMLFLTFGFTSILMILLLQQPLLTIWLGEETYEKSARFIRLFLYYNLAMLVNIIPFFFLNGSGHAKYNTYSEFFTRSVNILGMIILFQFLGNEGLIWGHIIGMLIATPLKTNLMTKFVIQEKSKFLSLESICCCVIAILIFEVPGIWTKLLLSVTFLSTFYTLYIQPVDFKKLFRSV